MIRDEVSERFKWHDWKNELNAHEHEARIRYVTADFMIGNRAIDLMVRKMSKNFIQSGQANFDNTHLKRAFADVCASSFPQNTDPQDIEVEFEFAFKPDSYATKMVYASLGNYLLNEKFRPDLATPFLEKNYEFKPLFLWEEELNEGEEHDVDGSIYILYRLYANRAKLALFMGDRRQIAFNAKRYLDLINIHKKHEITDDTVTYISISLSLLKTVQAAAMPHLTHQILKTEYSNSAEDKSYLSAFNINETEETLDAYEFLIRYNFDYVGQINLSQAMQYESPVVEIRPNSLQHWDIRSHVKDLNARRLKFVQDALPAEHTIILREKFHHEIYDLLIKSIIPGKTFDDVSKLPRSYIRAYRVERERRIKNREPLFDINRKGIQKLEKTLTKWADIFASSSSMSEIDKTLRQKEIKHLREWIKLQRSFPGRQVQ